MTESSSQDTMVATPVAAKTKKTATPKSKKSVAKKAVSSHPPTATMVNAAIKSLKERGGSSLQAIKKYISSTYKVDAEKMALFIKKYLKSAVDSGALIRTKGKGASGSFKLAVEGAKPKKKSVTKKPKAVTTTVKKTPKPKKKTVTPKKVVKPKTAAPKKSLSKVKKAAKPTVAKKPKSPKPKKAAPKKIAKKPTAKK